MPRFYSTNRGRRYNKNKHDRSKEDDEENEELKDVLDSEEFIIETVDSLKNLDPYKKQILKDAILECKFAGLGKYDRAKHVKARTKLNISNTLLDKLDKIVSEEIPQDRIKYVDWYAKGGFLDFYQERLEEMQLIQKITMEKLMYELRKPEQMQKYYIITAYLKEARDNNERLSVLGLSTPLVAQVRAYIDTLERNNNNNPLIIGKEKNSSLEDKTDNNIIDTGRLRNKNREGDQTEQELPINNSEANSNKHRSISQDNASDRALDQSNEERSEDSRRTSNGKHISQHMEYPEEIF